MHKAVYYVLEASSFRTSLIKSSCCNVNVMHFKIHHFVSSSIDKSDPKKGKEDAFIEIPDLYNVFVNSSYLR